MKIAVPSTGPSIDSPIDRTGRAAYYVLYDTDTGQYNVVENPARMAAGGAGIQAAQFLVSQGVSTVVVRSIGPNAMNVLSAAGIRVVTTPSATVRGAIDDFLNNRVSPVTVPTGPGFGPGMGRGGWGGGRGGWGGRRGKWGGW